MKSLSLTLQELFGVLKYVSYCSFSLFHQKLMTNLNITYSTGKITELPIYEFGFIISIQFSFN